MYYYYSFFLLLFYYRGVDVDVDTYWWFVGICISAARGGDGIISTAERVQRTSREYGQVVQTLTRIQSYAGVPPCVGGNIRYSVAGN